MAVIVVKLNGLEISRLTLESGKEYIAGRAQDADIHLDTQKAISRHHLKLYERDGVWVCEALSKFMLLQVGSESVQVIELGEPRVFMVTPYEFCFEPTVSAPEQKSSEEEAKPANLPAFFQPRLNPPARGPEHTAPRANNEATVAGASSLVPYFRISYPNTADDEVLKLEGELWVAGRDSSSEIPIDSPHISRKHFELARTVDGFFLTDLGSSNGTRVNGQRVPPHEPTKLESGDEIRVQNIEMTFEIRDVQFSNRLDRLPVPAYDPMLNGAPEPYYAPTPMLMEPTQYHQAAEAVTGWRGQWQKLRKNKVRMAIVALVPIIVALALMPDKSKDPKNPPRDPAGSAKFETLSKEEKLVVKDSFALARALYVQGKYALCLTELAKLHEVIPQYENSKELQSFCEQGLELARREEERQRQLHEREEVEQRIQSYVDICKQQLSPEADVEETRRCLAPAIELAPEHGLVIEMVHTAQAHEQEKIFLATQKKVMDAKAAKAVAHFNRALATYKKGQLARSLTELEKFLKTQYPRSEDLKDQARRHIASIKKELKTKVDSFLEQCKQLGGKNKFRDAYIACDKATDEDPGNAEAKEIKKKMLDELHREMKAIYEDSVLEESLGNVDSAKEKWRKIVQEDLPNDDYTKKAKSKLQKFGAGM